MIVIQSRVDTAVKAMLRALIQYVLLKFLSKICIAKGYNENRSLS